MKQIDRWFRSVPSLHRCNTSPAPRANGASLCLYEDLQDLRSSHVRHDIERITHGMASILRSRKIGIGAASPVREGANIIRKRPTQFVNTRCNQLEMGTVLKTRILTNLFVVLMTRQVHAQNRVVIIGGELSSGSID